MTDEELRKLYREKRILPSLADYARLTHYELLGVSDRSSPDQIRAACGELDKHWQARSSHSTLRDHAAFMKNISRDAVAVLCDPSKKATYDKELAKRRAQEKLADLEPKIRFLAEGIVADGVVTPKERETFRTRAREVGMDLIRAEQILEEELANVRHQEAVSEKARKAEEERKVEETRKVAEARRKEDACRKAEQERSVRQEVEDQRTREEAARKEAQERAKRAGHPRMTIYASVILVALICLQLAVKLDGCVNDRPLIPKKMDIEYWMERLAEGVEADFGH